MNHEDKFFHFAGCFTVFMLLASFLPLTVAAIITYIGAVAVEIYQLLYEPAYEGKALDTFLDLIMDFFGITTGTIYIRRLRNE